MAKVQKFNHSMIEKYLKTTGLKYLRDQDGDFRIAFSYDKDWGCSLTCWLIAGGKDKEIYTVRVHSDKRIPKSDWAQAMMLCNTWNKERRWPKAFLRVEDTTSDEDGKIILEEGIDLEEGIHQELLDSFTQIIIATGFSFWKWAHKEQGL